MGVLFDMDGVIADTNPFHKISIQEFCRRHQIEASDDFLREKVYGRVNREWIPNLFGKLSITEVETLAAEKEQLFRELYAPHLKPVEGLLDFLQMLQENKIKAAVATSAPFENAEFILSGLEISHYFQAVLHSADVEQGKPHPEIYLKAAAALNESPANCIVIEDSIAGVQAGRAAGCKVIAITTTHQAEEFDPVEKVIADFAGLGVEQLEKLW
ncbi:MAG: HAD family phosphatase [Saprospiraceae bacterium]|nr:HAD family phosphatase [Saprospiraceae bacterium]